MMNGPAGRAVDEIGANVIAMQAVDNARANQQSTTMMSTAILGLALERYEAELAEMRLTLNAIDGIIVYDSLNGSWSGSDRMRLIQHWVRRSLGVECVDCPGCENEHPSRQAVLARFRIALLKWVQSHTINRSRIPECEWPKHAQSRVRTAALVSDNEAVEELLDALREA